MLSETYRPLAFNAVIGQDKVVSRLKLIQSRGGFGGKAYWFSGSSGTGKTSLAKIVAADVADELATVELDAAGLTVAELQELERSLRCRSIGKGGRAIIVNEAHALRKPVIRQLLVMLERIAPHVVWLFTTTSEGQDALFEDCEDASPLLSRCLRFDLSRRIGAELIAEYVRGIAVKEGIDGFPMERYVKLVKEKRNNIRACFMAVESGELC